MRAVYWDPLTLGTLQRDEFWYSYDAANRFLITKGSLSGARATSAGSTASTVVQGSQGTVLTYDLAGERTSARNTDGSLESYSYSSDGLLEDTRINGVLRARRRVDALGRTLEYKELDTAGNLATGHTYTYDRDNRLLSDAASNPKDTTGDGVLRYFYFNDLSDSQDLASQGGKGALARTAFTPNDSAGTSITTFYTYQYWDSAKQDSIKKQAANDTAPNWAPGLSKQSYDVNGYLAASVDTLNGRTLNYVSNATGLVLSRTDNQGAIPYRHDWYYAAGRAVGDVTTDPRDTFRTSYAESLAKAQAAQPLDSLARFAALRPVTSADFDQSYEPISASYPGNTTGSYTVRGGDDLRSIAQNLWGDSAMWYLIAQANGLTGAETLVSGQVLVIPNRVTNIHNNAGTWRPYNPGEVIGHLDPTLPDPPPPPVQDDDGGCGGMGDMIMIAVAVVATIYTAGAAAELLGATVAGSAGTFSTGLAVLAGGTAAGVTVTGTAAMIAGAAIGAAVGSIASQGVGLLTGNAKSLSWSAVGQAALGGAVTAGVGGALTSAASEGQFANWANEALSTEGSWSGAAIRAGASSGAAMAVQGQWSWRNVMISTVSAGAGAAMGDAMSSQAWAQAGNGVGQRLVSGLTGSLAARALYGARNQRFESVFAATLGSAIGGSLAASDVQGQGPWSAADYRADVESDDHAIAALVPQDVIANSARNEIEIPMGGADYSNPVSEPAQAGGGGTSSFRQQRLDRIMRLANEPTALGSDAPPVFRVEISGTSTPDEYNAAQVQRAFEKGWDLRPTVANAARLELWSGGAPTPSDAIDEGAMYSTLGDANPMAYRLESDSTRGKFITGFGTALWHGVTELPLEVTDVVTAAWNVARGDDQYVGYSLLGQQAMRGAGTEELGIEVAKNALSVFPLIGAPRSAYNLTEAMQNGDSEAAGGALAGLAGSFALAKAKGYDTTAIVSDGLPTARLSQRGAVATFRLERVQATGGVADETVVGASEIGNTGGSPAFVPYWNGTAELNFNVETGQLGSTESSSFRIASDQFVLPNGRVIIPSRTDPNGASQFIHGTFDASTGELSIGKVYTANRGLGIGTELTSRAVEQFGAENVTSISGELGADNLRIYNQALSQGATPMEAARQTPAAAIRARLGYGNITFDPVTGVITGTRP